MNTNFGDDRGRAVLVADDDRTMRRILTAILEKNGYRVTTAENGQQVVERANRNALPALVVTDWEMPGMSGIDVCRALRERPDGDRFYLIVVTGNTTEQHLLTALEAGADDFIPKPPRVPELLARVRAGKRVVEMRERLASQVVALEQALAEVRTLRGLIPICMHCHRIRTGPSDWQRLEAYLEAHSEALMSHVLCDECMEKFYPETEEEGAA